MNKIPIVAVVGPTASGKTELAINLAQKLGGEIISADSMQIYKGMHIASAAPDDEEKQGIPHHLIEFLSPDKNFSVVDYVGLAGRTASEIISRNKAVILVGGTGLYINSLLDNITFDDTQPDMALREKLNREYAEKGGEAMLEELRRFDPQSADRLHPNNNKRIIRAFEIYLSSGITMTQQLENSKNEPSPYIPYMIGLTYSDRSLLYERINLRVDKMLMSGLLDEAKKAYDSQNRGTGSQAIGHKEFFPFFEGKATLEECTETLKAETRRYAKRQLTWFRKDERIDWICKDLTDNPLDEALKTLERKGYFDTK